jgi:murein DD-endopeptidase MepM/ murein hydrolase activator NlpD
MNCAVFRTIRFFLIISFLYSIGLCRAAEAQEYAPPSRAFPSIDRLDTRDTVFKQYLEDVDFARRRLFGQNRPREEHREELGSILRLYSYTPKSGEDLFRLSARSNIPYAALATLNRITHPDQLAGTVLLPTVPGLFIPENPGNDLEYLLAASRNSEDGTVINIAPGGSRRFLFFPGADFSPTERSFFLNPGFRYPLRIYRITSSFGMRTDPFTGTIQNHRGVDLAAPEGTDVYATKAGRVTEVGNDPVFGNYIIIAHDDRWASLYGHLSSVSTRVNSAVTGSTVIGKVGSTGQSTGPHLHFELRRNGTPLDPTKLLFRH